MIAKTNTEHYQNIADEIRTANDYATFKSEIEVDNELFEDIGEAIAEKDGGEIPKRSELVERIEAIPFFDYDLPVEDNQIKMLVYIHPEITHCFVNYIQRVANDVEVDWGDGTTVDTSDRTGRDRYTCAFVSHDYETIGLKVITLTAKQEIFGLLSSNGFISFAGADGRTNGNEFPNNYYRGSVIGLSFGNNTEGQADECKALVFIYNTNTAIARYNNSLKNITFRSGIMNDSLSLSGALIRNIKIPSTIRKFQTNGFRDCSFLGVVDFTDFTIDELSQCTFGSTLFTGATNNGLTILFKDQETAEYAKTITNLSAWADYIKYVGEVED